MNCQNAAWCPLLQAGYSAPEPCNMRAMLPESDDKQICSGRAKKRNDPVNFFGFDQMASYLNGVSAPFSDGDLHEPLVRSPPIRFEALHHTGINCEGQSGIYGRWLNDSDRLQGRAKQLA